MEYEEILDHLGGFGSYQIILFICVGFPTFKNAFDFIFHFFAIYHTNFRCADQDHLMQNASINKLYNGVFSEKIHHIQHYHVESIENITFDNQCQNSFNNNSPCATFQFEPFVMHSTLVSEMQLICSRAWYVPIFTAIPSVGILVGQLFGAFLDSKFQLGRRTMMLACFTMDAILTPFSAFMPNIESQIFIKFLRTIPCYVCISQCLILITEITPLKRRSFVGNNIWLFWSFGYALAPVIAYLKPERKFLDLINIVPCFVYIIIFMLAVESPRWLLLKGRKEEAIKMLSKIGKFNRKNIDVSMLTSIKLQESNALKAGLFESLRKYPKFRITFLIICIVVFIHSFTYYGISMDLEFVNTNIFLSTFLSGLIEFPSSILGWKLCDVKWLGRRRSIFGLQLIAGVCLIIVPFIPKENLTWLKMSVAIIGKLNLTAATQIFMLFIIELIPTSIRTNGALLTNFINVSGSIAASYIVKTEHSYFFPGVLFGTLALASASLLLFLPETQGRELPENFEEYENTMQIEPRAPFIQIKKDEDKIEDVAFL